MISTVNPKHTSYKCPNQTASEFHAVYAMLQRLKSSKKMTSDADPSAIMNMNEQIELFGRKVPVLRHRGNTRRTKTAAGRQPKKQQQPEPLYNVQRGVTEQQWTKVMTTRFDYTSYCTLKGVTPQTADPEPDDFKMVKQLNARKVAKARTARKQQKSVNSSNALKSETNGGDVDAMRTPSRLNQLFTSILKRDGDGHLNAVQNWRFLERGLPSRECMDCGAALSVIPLMHIGDGETADRNSKSGTRSVGMYKIAVICPNYPDCTFPLHRATYSKYWVLSAWYDDRRRTRPGNGSRDRSKSVSLKREREHSADSQSRSKRRKLAESASRPRQPVRERVNSYQFLQSLSSTTSMAPSRSSSREPRLNEKNLRKLFATNQRRKGGVTVIDDSRSDITASTASLLSRVSLKSCDSSRSSVSRSAPALSANGSSDTNMVLK